MRSRIPVVALIVATAVLSPTASAQADRIRTDQWHLRYLKVTEAHKITQGEGVTVAVPDTGVDPHPDLRDNLLTGIDLVTGDGDGRQDRSSHGTAMAGLIAAHGGSGTRGALGIAPKARILPVVSASKDNQGTAENLAAGITFAVANSADVISISSVGGSSVHLRRAVDSALRANVIVVAAAGNRPEDHTVGYPASHEGVITVGGIDRAGRHAAISVTGREIDVVAPAVDIYSTSINGKYARGTGTSSATAIVAGAAALIRAKYPYLPVEEVVHRLTATAIDKGAPGRDDEYGYGVIDMVAALTADVPPFGFESAAAAAATSSAPATSEAAGPGDRTVRGLVALGVLGVVGGGVWAVAARRRRRADAPQPRISR